MNDLTQHSPQLKNLLGRTLVFAFMLIGFLYAINYMKSGLLKFEAKQLEQLRVEEANHTPAKETEPCQN